LDRPDRDLPRIEVIDVRAGRSCGRAALELAHRGVVALSLDFDTAVMRVPHPSADAVLRCDLLDEIAKPDALNAPRDEITPGDTHIEIEEWLWT
jgi:hypothetical protein